MAARGRLNVVERAAKVLDLFESLAEEERELYANAFRFVDFNLVRAEVAQLPVDPEGLISKIR